MGKAEKRARKKQGRQSRIEAETKAAEKRRKRNLNIVLAAIIVVIAAAVAFHELTKTKPKSKPKPVAATCTHTAPPKGTPLSQSTPPPMTISTSTAYTATIKTSCGTIVASLDAKDSPNTVNSFVYLASKGFYNGLTFHRIVKNFAIQGGDPKGDGTGGPGYQVVDPVPAGVTYTAGTLAMANSGTVGGAGSQFFIVPDAPNVGAAYQLDYAILGHVTSGMNVVSDLNDVNTITNSQGEKSQPSPPVYIDSITVSP